MKRMLLAVLSAVCLHASAQITVTSATFPAVGDTFRYAIDLTPTGTGFITPAGGPKQWDFSGLQFEQTTETVYKAASTGKNVASFPGADLVVNTQGGETYFNVTNTKVENLGYTGGDPTNFGLNVLAKFAPPIVERWSPMEFVGSNIQESNLSLPFSTDALPDSLLANIPGGTLIDSIRVRINVKRQEIVDAFGDLKIPGLTNFTPVLRVKRTEYRTTALDVHSFLGWIPIPTGGGTTPGIGNFLGTDTTITFRFLSNLHKEELAVVTASTDLSTVESVRFKNIGNTTPAPELLAPGVASVQAFPNPAVEWVRFDCANLPADQYTLKIFNIVGKVVWKETFSLAGNRSIRVDLDDFKKGTYLYSLVDKKGGIIGTKRLVVVKP